MLYVNCCPSFHNTYMFIKGVLSRLKKHLLKGKPKPLQKTNPICIMGKTLYLAQPSHIHSIYCTMNNRAYFLSNSILSIHIKVYLQQHALHVHGIPTVPYHITIGVALPVHTNLIRHDRQTKNGLYSWELYSQLLSNRQTLHLGPYPTVLSSLVATP